MKLLTTAKSTMQNAALVLRMEQSLAAVTGMLMDSAKKLQGSVVLLDQVKATPQADFFANFQKFGLEGGRS